MSHLAFRIGDPTRNPSQVTPHAFCAAVLGLIVWCYLFFIRPAQEHLAWYRLIEYRILRLAEKRPDRVDPKQWAACIKWTWQLHGNYGGYSYFHARARERFLAEFDRRLAGEVDLATIDWIWDQYWLHSSRGEQYSHRYRPTTAEKLKLATEDRYGENNLEELIGELKRLREEEKATR